MMKRERLRNCIVIGILLVLFTSCAHYKDIPYFQNSAEYDGSKGAKLYDMTIKPKDELTIFVFSSIGGESVMLFNMTDPVPADYTQEYLSPSSGYQIHPYLVDNEGNIDFPILGKIHVGGLTLNQTSEKIRQLVLPYLAGKDCIVNTYIENYQISVLGEVKYPYTFYYFATQNKCFRGACYGWRHDYLWKT